MSAPAPAPEAAEQRPSRWRRLLRRLMRLTAFGAGSAAVAVIVLLIAVGDRVRLLDPLATVVLHDRQGRFLGEPGTTARLGFWPVDPDALPERVVAATLAIEDRRFFEHPGVDALAIARAVGQNIRSGRRISGASTIPMQVARLQNPAARTWPNKLLEAATALRLVFRYGRAEVLAQYLRLAPYGNNVHGIGYAARRYFDKPVADLSWAETAFLCGLPQSPGLYNPYAVRGRERARVRARRILNALRDQRRISETIHRQALVELKALAVVPRPVRPDATLHPLFAFERQLETLRAELGTDLRVQTTLDLPLQASIQNRLRAALTEWADDGAGNAAVVVVELTDDGRAVRAAVGSSDWHDAERAGAIDFTRVRRAPASTLKPFLFAQALEQGVITPDSVLDDLLRAGDGIGNSDGRFLGPMLPRAALANSRNVPAVELLERLGVGTFHSLLRDLGLHARTFVGNEALALAIGGLPVRLIDLVQGFGSLATDGTVADLRWYARQPRTARKRVLREATARQITQWLSDPMARLPTFPRGGHLELPFPVAIKTGTTGDFRDAWTVAWSRRYLIGVWVGHPEWRPMRGLSGYRAAASLARDIMLDLHPEGRSGLSDVGFPAPVGWQPATLCALTGARATASCEAQVIEHFPEGEAPEHDCEAHSRLSLDRRTGQLADAATPAVDREARTFVTLPPRYAAWMRQAGLEPPPGQSQTAPDMLQDRAPRIRIVAPRPGTQLIRDPDAPPELSTVLLQAEVDPPVPQVVWYVDGQPVAVADAPYRSRWPIEPGAHLIEARLPFSDVRSAPVRIVSR